MEKITQADINRAIYEWLDEAGVRPDSDTATVFSKGFEEGADWIMKQIESESRSKE